MKIGDFDSVYSIKFGNIEARVKLAKSEDIRATKFRRRRHSHVEHGGLARVSAHSRRCRSEPEASVIRCRRVTPRFKRCRGSKSASACARSVVLPDKLTQYRRVRPLPQSRHKLLPELIAAL